MRKEFAFFEKDEAALAKLAVTEGKGTQMSQEKPENLKNQEMEAERSMTKKKKKFKPLVRKT